MTSVDYDALFQRHREHLWGLCYRMTGSAADAEDLVQDTFRRAIESPPPDTDRPWRPWLVRVATHLAIDALRRRRTRGYEGPWLPSPVPTPSGSALGELASAEVDVETRYDLRESVSLAFLCALEALPPAQRAVLVLRDALGYTGPEAAELLGISPENARVLLHRARHTMERYDGARQPPSPEVDARHEAALQRFMLALAQGDVSGLAACLAEDVRTTTDGGGRYRAATKPVLGRDRVARFFAGLRSHGGMPQTIVPCWINGRPGLLVDLPVAHERDAPRLCMTLDVDEHGAVREMYVVSAPDKLAALPFAR